MRARHPTCYVCQVVLAIDDDFGKKTILTTRLHIHAQAGLEIEEANLCEDWLYIFSKLLQGMKQKGIVLTYLIHYPG